MASTATPSEQGAAPVFLRSVVWVAAKMAMTKDGIVIGVRAALEQVRGPDGVPLAQGGRLSDIVVQGGRVYFFIAVAANEAPAWEATNTTVLDADSGWKQSAPALMAQAASNSVSG